MTQGGTRAQPAEAVTTGEFQVVAPSDAHVTGVRTFVVDVPSLLATAEITAPMDRHERYRHRRTSWYGLMHQVLVLVDSSDGRTGVGLTGGGRAAAAVITDHLARLVVGEPAHDIERLWDVGHRATIPYGAEGLSSMALSGVDLALWDLAGRRAGAPVHELLGGRVGDRVPAYASGNDPEWYAELGFTAAKVSMRYGPWDGQDAVAGNVDIVRRARAALGDGGRVMVDAWMGWTVEFSLRMARALEPYDVYWVEEPLPPDQVAEHAEVRRALSPTRLAAGEHHYGLAAFDRLATAGAADVWQPDLAWCGGITAGRAICRRAEAAGIPVAPHLGASPWALHLLATIPNGHMAEWYAATLPGQVPGSEPTVLRGAPVPTGGTVAPGDEPGVGVEVDWDAVERYG